MSDMRIYVADLSAYNSGILHGAWIDATDDVDEMQEAVSAMLRKSPCPNVVVVCPECEGAGKPFGFGDSVCAVCHGKGEVPSAEEYAIHDFDGLPSTLGEYCGLQAVADFVGLVWVAEDGGLGPDQALEVARAAVENWHSVEYAKEALEDRFVGVFDTFREYADDAADEMIAAYTHGRNVPQDLINYFDYEAYARDLKFGMTVLDLPSGDVAVFHE